MRDPLLEVPEDLRVEVEPEVAPLDEEEARAALYREQQRKRRDNMRAMKVAMKGDKDAKKRLTQNLAAIRKGAR